MGTGEGSASCQAARRGGRRATCTWPTCQRKKLVSWSGFTVHSEQVQFALFRSRDEGARNRSRVGTQAYARTSRR
jgi:hypothetical protein